MSDLRFNLTRSKRVCYRGHTDTFDIEGANAASREWLGTWDLYCHTCKALTIDLGQFQAAKRQKRSKGVIGFVTQAPLKLNIVR